MRFVIALYFLAHGGISCCYHALPGVPGMGWVNHRRTHKTYVMLYKCHSTPIPDFGPGTTTNAIVMIGYSIGNAAGPFMWKKQYQPRYIYLTFPSNISSKHRGRDRIPWIVIASTSFASGVLLLILRYILTTENKRRDQEHSQDMFDDVYINEVDDNGKSTEKKVDKVCKFSFRNIDHEF